MKTSTPAKRFRIAGLIILCFFFGVALFAPLIATYDPYKRSGKPFEQPGLNHFLGCNDVGHDLFSEIVYGGRMSLTIGLFTAFYATAVATAVALASGYLRGWVDNLLMRIVDVVMSLPFLPLMIVIGVFMGPGIFTQVFVISIVMWAHPARELRSQVLKVRESGYVEAARSMGGSPVSVIFHHIIPEIMPLIVPQFVRVAQRAILIESSLSFLGLGDPVQKSWGSILFFANTRAAFLTGAWTYWVLPPGICIALVVLGFALVGFSLGGKSGLSFQPFGSFSLTRKEIDNPAPFSGRDKSGLLIDHLNTSYILRDETIRAVDNVCLNIEKNECIGIVGESGCGKSTLAMSVLGLLKYPASITNGRIFLGPTELLGLKISELEKIRGKRIAYIPQNAMNALNPVMIVKKQLMEAILVHRKIGKKAAEREAFKLLSLVEIEANRVDSYPHELSGGMRQRVVIAMALANEPEVVVADEPTTGLDVLVQREIIRLLLELQKILKVSIVFITHDLPLVTGFADRLVVMYRGKIVDKGKVSELYMEPEHHHTKELFENFPRLGEAKRWNRKAVFEGLSSIPHALLRISMVSKTFDIDGLRIGIFNSVRALDKVSFEVHEGEVVGLIGGSGSGKTTLARIVMGLIRPDKGRVVFNGKDIGNLKKNERREMFKEIHMVFQDPYQSIRNGMRVKDIVAEPLRIQGLRDREVIEGRVIRAMEEVNLPGTKLFLNRFPTELSGGQRQRVAFARAIVSNPKFIIADEPTSMLDVSLRTGLLEQMETLRKNHNVGYLFITHDIALARHFCDRLLVMNNGKLIEEGKTDQVVYNPSHPYTKALIEAVEDPKFLNPVKQKSNKIYAQRSTLRASAGLQPQLKL